MFEHNRATVHLKSDTPNMFHCRDSKVVLIFKRFQPSTKPTHLIFFTGKWGYHRQGSCQAGLGGAIDKVRSKYKYPDIPPSPAQAHPPSHNSLYRIVIPKLSYKISPGLQWWMTLRKIWNIFISVWRPIICGSCRILVLARYVRISSVNPRPNI